DPAARAGLQLLGQVHKSQGAAPEVEAAAPDPARQCLEFGRRLAGFGPLYASEPATQFCLQAARRRLGEGGAAQEWYGRLQQVVTQGPWHEAAGAERWLVARAAAAPKRLGRCTLTDVRPYLDGNFDDPCWQSQAPLRLDNAA